MILTDIDNTNIQEEINRYAKAVNQRTGKPHSPKSIRNFNGFISAVLGMYRPNFRFKTKLPKKVRPDTYIPTDEDITALLSYVRGSQYEIPFLLALFSLRRSEICGLHIEDFTDTGVSIHRVKVCDVDGNWVMKDITKTEAGERFIPLPPYVLDRVRSFHYTGYIFSRSPHALLKHLIKCQEALNLPRFKLHSLRHYYASTSKALLIPDEYIMQAGGWKSQQSMAVYDHALKDWTETFNNKIGNHIVSLAAQAENPVFS